MCLADTRSPAWVDSADRAIRRVLRAKTGVRLPSLAELGSASKPQGRGRPEVEEALDIHGDAMAHVARHVSCGAEIGDVGRYAEQVAYRAFCASLRTKHQNRYQTRLRIHHVLCGRTNALGLTMWAADRGGTRLCGFQQWHDEGKKRDCTARLLRGGLGEKWRRKFISRVLRGRDPQEFTLHRLLAAIFDSVGGPVEFESLVAAVVSLLQKGEPRRAMDSRYDDVHRGSEMALSPDHFCGMPASDAVQRAIDRDTLVWACSEISRLPDNQRLAILLPLESDLLRMLTGIARQTGVRDLLGCGKRESLTVLDEMPLDDNRIASRMGLTRQQVINLRSAARRRLTRRYAMAVGVEEQSV